MKFLKALFEKMTDAPRQRTQLIALILGISLAALLSLVFMGGEPSYQDARLREGQISSRDVYAPVDFSFSDAGGSRIEIKKNETVMQRGDRITKTQEMALAVLRDMHRQPRWLQYYLGIMMLLVICTVVMITYIRIHIAPEVFTPPIVFLLCVFSLSIVLATKWFLLASWPLVMIPLASISMMVAVLIDPGMAFLLTLVLTAFLGIIFNIRLDIVSMLVIGSIVGIYGVRDVQRRRDLTKAGLLIGLTNMVVLVAFSLLKHVPIDERIVEAGWGLANGIICGIIVTGLLPVFEMLFGISTNISLLELSDLNHPLLKELVMKAPGTYHHSLVVGNLAEAAAEVTGANRLLARVGAYFHDIGKMRMAPYFSENQIYTDNKHETLSPTISSLVIINHIKEGAELARKYKLGRAIIDIITQHHGDDVVVFFYHRALEQQDEDKNQVTPEDFRYAGPRPQTKEAAIVMLADASEAATKAIAQPTPAKINDVVTKVINNKFIDGQLDECDLTLRDLHQIAEVFTHILSGIFHTRVEYPEMEKAANESRSGEKSSGPGPLA